MCKAQHVPGKGFARIWLQYVKYWDPRMSGNWQPPVMCVPLMQDFRAAFTNLCFQPGRWSTWTKSWSRETHLPWQPPAKWEIDKRLSCLSRWLCVLCWRLLVSILISTLGTYGQASLRGTGDSLCPSLSCMGGNLSNSVYWTCLSSVCVSLDLLFPSAWSWDRVFQMQEARERVVLPGR